MKKYFLPTYEQAKEISTANENFIFFETLHKLEGFDISIFAYRLSPKNFDNPLNLENNDGDVTAYENRGLTYVFNEDGSLYKRYLLMNKFFNINQVEDTMYHNIKDLKVKNVMNKEDGSVITFIRLPNGSVYGKSKASFISYQATSANTLFEKNHKNIAPFINWTLDKDIIAVFEYVSPYNEIVLRYTDEDLILLKLRCNVTGKYLDINNTIAEYISETGNNVSFPVAKFIENITLDDIIAKAETETDLEGWIIEFEDNEKIDLLKIKTNWYFYQHSISYSIINRENIIIRMILDETIDDALSLDLTDDLRKYINDIIVIIDNYIEEKYAEIITNVEEHDKTGGTKLDLFNKVKSFQYRTILMRYNEHRNKEKILADLKYNFRANVWTLTKAVNFLMDIGFDVKKFVNKNDETKIDETN